MNVGLYECTNRFIHGSCVCVGDGKLPNLFDGGLVALNGERPLYNVLFISSDYFCCCQSSIITIIISSRSRDSPLSDIYTCVCLCMYFFLPLSMLFLKKIRLWFVCAVARIPPRFVDSIRLMRPLLIRILEYNTRLLSLPVRLLFHLDNALQKRMVAFPKQKHALFHMLHSFQVGLVCRRRVRCFVRSTGTIGAGTCVADICVGEYSSCVLLMVLLMLLNGSHLSICSCCFACGNSRWQRSGTHCT